VVPLIAAPTRRNHKSGCNDRNFCNFWVTTMLQSAIWNRHCPSSTRRVLNDRSNDNPCINSLFYWSSSFSTKSGQINSYVGQGMFFSAPAKNVSS
jgi:hypothetical protein